MEILITNKRAEQIKIVVYKYYTNGSLILFGIYNEPHIHAPFTPDIVVNEETLWSVIIQRLQTIFVFLLKPFFTSHVS